jgi:acyl-CoA thioester hydrolase
MTGTAERPLVETAPEDWPFACLFRVRYSEIDGQQIVFNAHYLTWFDTALAEYFRHLGIVYGSARDGTEPVDFHTVRNLIDYHAPVRFDEVIAVCARPGRIGRASVTFELALFARGEERPRATGQVVWVCAGIGDHLSRPIPEPLRARFEAARTAERVEIDPVRI